MITEKGKIKDGTKEYTIKGLSVNEYLNYVEFTKQANDAFKSFEWIIKKCLYRVIEFKFFKKVVYSKAVFDFDLNKIDISEFEKFQEDLFKIIFGETFMHKINTEVVD
jgi:hypothetical protein